MFTTSRTARLIAQRNQLRAAVLSISAIATITATTGLGTGTGTISITTSITGEGRCG